jgi:ribonuclease Y
MLTTLAALIGLGLGAGLAGAFLMLRSGSRVHVAEREAETIRREAQIEARELAVKLRAEVENEVQERRSEASKIEEQLTGAEHELALRSTEVERREQGLADRETHVKQLQEDLKGAKDEALVQLEKAAGLTVAEAKQHLLERSQDLIRHELARSVRQQEEEARTESRRRARALIADALQRVAASHTAETTVTVVELPSDDM